ncbi:peptide chain release factor 1 [Halogeometricum sp. S1BR25-6]|uniref:Peptide chain release factor 1 n=1 Tax=Halogeometricum salsisoli TaxID=2950536 RepID=A0ABU2GKP2_9EURY|nr:Vms1/Ankzf1 family peptidyl-tRNA hydrolase [Halogeometricum sp. S1BR25-6]MDS0300859.1 peptide chain release factor 1 [Halogeometricum sp. S1BR25-6]
MSSTASDLHDRIEAVSNADADGEQLVSVAVPPEESLEATRRRVEEDHAEAEYLDVREEVRKPLKQALEETRRVLHEYEETPENGLVAYVGVVDTELVTHVFDDLPTPISTGTYEYGNEFDTDPLSPATTQTDTHGLLVVSRDSATLGRYDGETIEHVDTVESDVPSKQTAAGGQEDDFQGRSQERADEFYDEIGEAAARVFLDDAPSDAVDDASPGTEFAGEALLVGGSEVTTERFLEGDHLSEPLADAAVGPFDAEYASEQGLRELVDAAEESGELGTTDARGTLERFFAALDDDEETAIGGREDVERALELDAVDTLVVADSLAEEEVQSLAERVEEQGGQSVVAPEGLDRTERLEAAFDGVGALLRFPIE